MEVGKVTDMVVINVGHSAWAAEGRERQSQAGPKGQKLARFGVGGPSSGVRWVCESGRAA